jgi:drug/metabolite transporter (DMT)-like permease
MFLPALLLIVAAATGVAGARFSIATRDGKGWWLTLVSSAAASGSWSWTANAWPGSLLVASVLWNIAHDFGEYGALALHERPNAPQIVGIVLVIVGCVLVSAYAKE